MFSRYVSGFYVLIVCVRQCRTVWLVVIFERKTLIVAGQDGFC